MTDTSRHDRERRLLQAATGIAALVPILAGLHGVIAGPAMLRDIEAPVPPDLDSHYRYLSGLLLGIGIAFMLCVREIEARAPLYRFLGAIVVVGGLARLGSLVLIGTPGGGHLFGLAMELGVVPALMLWQRRIARLHVGLGAR